MTDYIEKRKLWMSDCGESNDDDDGGGGGFTCAFVFSLLMSSA